VYSLLIFIFLWTFMSEINLDDDDDDDKDKTLNGRFLLRAENQDSIPKSI